MKKLITVLSLVFMSLTASAASSLNDKYTQEELRALLAKSPRCTLAPATGSQNADFSQVTVIMADNSNGDTIYFAEVIQPKSEPVLLHLVKTGIVYAGYILEASSGLPYIGLDLKASVNLSSGKGTDVTVVMKSGIMRNTNEYYKFCASK